MDTEERKLTQQQQDFSNSLKQWGDITHHRIVCPHCFEEMSDSWEYGDGGESDSEQTECGHCGQPFMWERDIQVSYTTRKD